MSIATFATFPLTNNRPQTNLIMNKKKYENHHEEALCRLCFVCGELLTGAVVCSVEEKHLEYLSQGLKCPALAMIPGVTPNNFCRKCFSSLSHVVKGHSVKCTRAEHLIDWVECSSDCSTCARLTEMKIPKRKKKVSFS